MNWLSSLLAGDSASVAWAMIGGFAVAAGLIIEKFAEILDDRFLGGYKAHNNLDWSGWYILMIGICIEVADAGWTAHEINNAKNAERNAPISKIEAIVFFTKMGMDLNELTNLPSGKAAQLTLWKDERQGTALDPLIAANGDISEYNPIIVFGTRDRRIYRMQFHSLNWLLAVSGVEHPVKTLDDVHLVHIDLNFLPRDSEIGGASVELIVNNLHKMFFAPEQNDTNSNLAYPLGFPCWFAATNGIQSSPKQFLYLRN
jgi:hypothetical protein